MGATLESSTAGLYNTLCDALHLSNKEFQMIQGVLPVQSDPSGLYNFIDGIPPVSIATLYTSNPLNGLNGNMQIIINDAKPGFITTLAENNYMNSKYWVDGNIAVDPIYTPTFDDLLRLVNNGSSAVVEFDSNTASSDISSSWAKSNNYGGVGFWGTSSESVSQSLNQKASSSRITVKITINKYAYLQVRAGGWFTQGFFTDQFKNPSKWINGQADWDKVFGLQGSCQNVANQVLLINGYTIEIISYADYSESDYSSVEKSSETNVWPFYTSSSHSIATQSHKYNDDKSISTIISCKPGSLQIFGMGVIPTKVAITGELSSKLI